MDSVSAKTLKKSPEGDRIANDALAVPEVPGGLLWVLNQVFPITPFILKPSYSSVYLFTAFSLTGMEAPWSQGPEDGFRSEAWNQAKKQWLQRYSLGPWCCSHVEGPGSQR